MKHADLLEAIDNQVQVYQHGPLFWTEQLVEGDGIRYVSWMTTGPEVVSLGTYIEWEDGEVSPITHTGELFQALEWILAPANMLLEGEEMATRRRQALGRANRIAAARASKLSTWTKAPEVSE